MDKMPDVLWIGVESADELSQICFLDEGEGTEYRRADLPKEVDLGALRKPILRTEPMLPITNAHAHGYNQCLDHLVALGVIKDKGV